MEILLGFRKSTPDHVRAIALGEPLGRITDRCWVWWRWFRIYPRTTRHLPHPDSGGHHLYGADGGIICGAGVCRQAGESIIEKRAAERMRLKEQLNRAERLSAMGEMAASISMRSANPWASSAARRTSQEKSVQDRSGQRPARHHRGGSSRLNGIITDFINYARPRSRSSARVG